MKYVSQSALLAEIEEISVNVIWRRRRRRSVAINEISKEAWYQ